MKSVLVIIPKKNDLTNCANYWTIVLITHLSKILLLIILQHLMAVLVKSRRDLGKAGALSQQILTLRLIAEKYLEKGRCVYNSFVDYTKAFDSVWHDWLWTVFHSFRIPEKLIVLLRNL